MLRSCSAQTGHDFVQENLQRSLVTRAQLYHMCVSPVFVQSGTWKLLIRSSGYEDARLEALLGILELLVRRSVRPWPNERLLAWPQAHGCMNHCLVF